MKKNYWQKNWELRNRIQLNKCDLLNYIRVRQSKRISNFHSLLLPIECSSGGYCRQWSFQLNRCTLNHGCKGGIYPQCILIRPMQSPLGGNSMVLQIRKFPKDPEGAFNPNQGRMVRRKLARHWLEEGSKTGRFERYCNSTQQKKGGENGHLQRM